MPLRGESVGTAYVRILADGSGLPQSIRDQFHQADGAFDDAGSVGAKRYKESFAKEMESHTGRTLDDSLSDALAREDFTHQFFDGPAWKKFQTNMHARFGGLGDDAAAQMEEKFTKRGSLQGIENDIEHVVSRINANVDKAISAAARDAEAQAKKMQAFEQDFRRTMAETETLSRQAADVSDQVGTRMTNVWHDIRDGFSKARFELDKFRLSQNGSSNDVQRSEHAFIRLSQTIDHMALGIGRAFGKGSRNNFLNFFGSFVTASVSVLGLFPRLLGNLGEFKDGFNLAQEAGSGFFTAMKDGFSTMGKDAEGASTALSGLFSSGPVGFIALGVAIAAVIPLLSIIAALVSGIAGAIVALASSISFALVGALTVLAPLLLPVAAGFAGIAGAILSIPKTQRAKIFKPLIDDLKELGKLTRQHFLKNFNVDLGELHGVIKLLDPLAKRVGNSLGILGTQFVKGFQSKQFKDILAQFTGFIPDAIRSLGHIAQHTAGLVGNILVDAIPFARQFLHWLNKITGEADKWVQAHPGKVFAFLHDAVDSAKNLAHFMGQVGAVLVDLLFNKSGKKAGDTIIDDMSKKLHDLDHFLDTHPAALKNFFKEGQQTARDIGNLVRNLSDFFAALNSPDGQKALHAIFRLTGLIVDLASALAQFGQGGWVFIEGGIAIAKKIGHAFQVAGGKIKDFFTNLGSGLTSGGGRTLSINPTGLVKWIPGVIGKIQGFFGRVAGIFGQIPGKAREDFNAAALAMGTAILHGVSKVSGYLGNIPQRMLGLTGRIAGAAAGWGTAIVGEFASVPGRIVDLFRGLASQIVSAIGTIIPHISLPHLPHIPGTAVGGTFDRASLRIIGEAGPEAVVPLNRPLSQVDPSVRWLSAIAQGLTPPPSTAGNGSAAKIINNEWHLTMPGTDPRAAAAELLNRMVASAY